MDHSAAATGKGRMSRRGETATAATASDGGATGEVKYGRASLRCAAAAASAAAAATTTSPPTLVVASEPCSNTPKSTAAATAKPPDTESVSRVVFPRANDILHHGIDVVVSWKYEESDSDPIPAVVDLELVRADNGYPVRTIATDVRNSRSFFWSVNTTIPVGGPYRILIAGIRRTGSSVMAALGGSGGRSVVRPPQGCIMSGPIYVERALSSVHQSQTARLRVPLSTPLPPSAGTGGATPDLLFGGAARAAVRTATTNVAASVTGSQQTTTVQAPMSVPVVTSPLPTRGLPRTTPLAPSQSPPATRSHGNGGGGGTLHRSQRSGGGGGGTVMAAVAGDNDSDGDDDLRGTLASRTLSDDEKRILYSYVYARSYMNAAMVRRNMRTLVQEGEREVSPHTVIDEANHLTAGQFAVRYLLCKYFKAQLHRYHPEAEKNIEESSSPASTTTLYPVPSPTLLACTLIPDTFRGHSNTAPAKATDIAATTSSSSDPTLAADSALATLGVVANNPPSRRGVQSCVTGLSIRQEREYLQRVRQWCIHIDSATLVDTESGMTAQQFALEYVRTDRRKRTENVRISKRKFVANGGVSSGNGGGRPAKHRRLAQSNEDSGGGAADDDELDRCETPSGSSGGSSSASDEG